MRRLHSENAPREPSSSRKSVAIVVGAVVALVVMLSVGIYASGLLLHRVVPTLGQPVSGAPLELSWEAEGPAPALFWRVPAGVPRHAHLDRESGQIFALEFRLSIDTRAMDRSGGPVTDPALPPPLAHDVGEWIATSVSVYRKPVLDPSDREAQLRFRRGIVSSRSVRHVALASYEIRDLVRLRFFSCPIGEASNSRKEIDPDCRQVEPEVLHPVDTTTNILVIYCPQQYLSPPLRCTVYSHIDGRQVTYSIPHGLLGAWRVFEDAVQAQVRMAIQ